VRRQSRGLRSAPVGGLRSSFGSGGGDGGVEDSHRFPDGLLAHPRMARVRSWSG
jgi:hypothetical protein